MTPASGVHSKDLERYLLDGERIVTAVRSHWALVARPVALGILGLVLVVWVDVNAPASAGNGVSVLWLAWLVLAGWVTWRLLEWRRDWFVATDKRFLMFYGFVTRKVSMMPLRKVTDMTYQRTVPGRLLRYGKFVLESAGQDQALSEINYVPNPDANYRAICAEIFGVGGTDPDEDEEYTRSDDEPPAAPPDRRGAGPRSLYRSPDLVPDERDADTGPLPVHRPRRD